MTPEEAVRQRRADGWEARRNSFGFLMWAHRRGNEWQPMTDAEACEVIREWQRIDDSAQPRTT